MAPLGGNEGRVAAVGSHISAGPEVRRPRGPERTTRRRPDPRASHINEVHGRWHIREDHMILNPRFRDGLIHLLVGVPHRDDPPPMARDPPAALPVDIEDEGDPGLARGLFEARAAAGAGFRPGCHGPSNAGAGMIRGGRKGPCGAVPGLAGNARGVGVPAAPSRTRRRGLGSRRAAFRPFLCANRIESNWRNPPPNCTSDRWV